MPPDLNEYSPLSLLPASAPLKDGPPSHEKRFYLRKEVEPWINLRNSVWQYDDDVTIGRRAKLVRRELLRRGLFQEGARIYTYYRLYALLRRRTIHSFVIQYLSQSYFRAWKQGDRDE